MGCAGNRLSQGKIQAYSSKEESRCALGLIRFISGKAYKLIPFTEINHVLFRLIIFIPLQIFTEYI